MSRSPPHGGADRNDIGSCLPHGADAPCRPLTGARIETLPSSAARPPPPVAPSRGRGSKPHRRGIVVAHHSVAPSRGRGSKHRMSQPALRQASACRPLTGARIETHEGFATATNNPARVAPSRGRGSKLVKLVGQCHDRVGGGSPPHGGADRNQSFSRLSSLSACRPLTGARIETSRRTPPARCVASPPHGGADRNIYASKVEVRRPRWSPPHGGADRNS